jgi:hypothetical protein
MKEETRRMSKKISGAPANDADATAKMRPFTVLIGDWRTEVKHPAMPGVIVKGTCRFEWLSGERFLVQRAQNDHPDFPDSISIIGVMEGEAEPSMQYFDSRGVHRLYRVAFDGRALKLWREDPDFAQRVAMALSADGATLAGVWQLNERGQGYKDDLTTTFHRA